MGGHMISCWHRFCRTTEIEELGIILTTVTHKSPVFITINLFIDYIELFIMTKSLKSSNTSKSFSCTFTIAAILLFYMRELWLNAKAKHLCIYYTWGVQKEKVFTGRTVEVRNKMLLRSFEIVCVSIYLSMQHQKVDWKWDFLKGNVIIWPICNLSSTLYI